MKIALVTTVKNERDLLRPNILYHRYLGIDLFYVFGDGSTDGTLATVADLPFVRATSTVPVAEYQHHPAFQLEITRYNSHHTSRQILNAFHAMQQARNEGVEWLVHLDPDELVCLDVQQTKRDHLRECLGSLDQRVESVKFEVLEIVQAAVEYENVFAEATLFKRPIFSIQRRISDPMAGTLVSIPTFYSHGQGKGAVRLSVNAKPLLHRFVNMDGTRLRTRAAGFLLHYFAYSFSDFVKKFQNKRLEPAASLHWGPVPYQQRLWRAIVNDPGFSREALREYYERWVAFSLLDVEKWRHWGKVFGRIPVRKPALVEVLSVRRICEELAKGGGGKRDGASTECA